MRKPLAFFLIVLGSLFLIGSPALGDPPEKVTICHAAGLDGTTHYETLTIGYNAVYGPGGHFNEDGTTQAGHEDDYLGPCKDDEGTDGVTDSTDDGTDGTDTGTDGSTDGTDTDGDTVVTDGSSESVDTPAVITRTAEPAVPMDTLPVTGAGTVAGVVIGLTLIGVGILLITRYG